MISKSTILHLRIPFSIKLLPIFILGLIQVPHPFSWNIFILFVLLHFVYYPASNGYNSYWDRDKESIAGIEKPPPTTEDLYWVSLGLDIIGFSTSISTFYWSPQVLVNIFLCAILSRAYSHPGIRLKKYPIWSWLIVGIFQGYVICISTIIIGLGAEQLVPRHHLTALLTTILLWTVYPITQIYQHSEDSRRGDQTLSILLGIKGTIIFSGIMSVVLFSSFISYFYIYFKPEYFPLLTGTFIFCELPFIITFLKFAHSVVCVDEIYANFQGTMKLMIVSSVSTNVYFLWLLGYCWSNNWECIEQ